MPKKRIVILSSIVVVVLSAALALRFFNLASQKPIIGTISGAEYEFIEIDGVRYAADLYNEHAANSFSSADRGEYLGSVTNGEITMRVFSVKGDDSGRFLYTLWDWDGAFYIRAD